MGICSNCIYFGELFMNGPNPDYRCNNQFNQSVDFVTGKITLGSCRVKNNFGECLKFDNGDIDVFGWSNENDTVFTTTDIPSVNDFVLSKDNEKLDAITSVVPMYFYGDYFAEKENLETGDLLYSSPDVEVGTISDIDTDSVTVDDVIYTRDKTKDSFYVKTENATYIRDSSADTVFSSK